jgi:hypothetical protein
VPLKLIAFIGLYRIYVSLIVTPGCRFSRVSLEERLVNPGKLWKSMEFHGNSWRIGIFSMLFGLFLSSHFQHCWNRLEIGWTFVVKEWKTMDFPSM